MKIHLPTEYRWIEVDYDHVFPFGNGCAVTEIDWYYRGSGEEAPIKKYNKDSLKLSGLRDNIKRGLINSKGDVILECKFTMDTNWEVDYIRYWQNTDRYRQGIVFKDGTIVLPCEYRDICVIGSKYIQATRIKIYPPDDKADREDNGNEFERELYEITKDGLIPMEVTFDNELLIHKFQEEEEPYNRPKNDQLDLDELDGLTF